jgi:NAD(P)-dependent dehydrogenase (short-subunit alcohol dehydrogenase family)
MDTNNPGRILITGGSSGIGAALAHAYAADGVTLFLGGRDRDRLEAVAAECRNRGAAVFVGCLDVTDREAMAGWINDAGAEAPLDLVIANAGISGGPGIAPGGDDTLPMEAPAQVRKIMAVNIDGVVNTVFPALDRMLGRAAPENGVRGQIAIMSSLAGFRGLPGAPAYSASKAAMRSWGEGLRGHLARHGVKVSVICPGFVVSPMTAGNPYPMPFLVATDRAAAIIKKGLARDRARIAFPWPLAAVVWLLAALPPSWLDPLVRRLPEKPAARP